MLRGSHGSLRSVSRSVIDRILEPLMVRRLFEPENFAYAVSTVLVTTYPVHTHSLQRL